MTVAYLDKTDLNIFLNAGANLDPSVQAALNNALITAGVYDNSSPDDGHKAWLQFDPFPGGAVSPLAQILDVPNTTTVQTDAALKAIIMDDAGGNHLTVTDLPGAGNSIFIAMGAGSDTLSLFDSGNDTVYGGSGNDVIGAGTGNDSIFGGDGNDSIYGGSGADTLIGGSGDNFIQAGTGAHQLLESGGSGNNLLVDFLSGSSTLVAGTGADTIWGYGSDTLIGGSGHTELHGGTNSLLISGSGSGGWNVLGSGSTDSSNANILQGGAGADTLYGGGGADTLYGGSGNNELIAGSGSHQLLQAGTGNNFLVDTHSGGTDTLTGGSGNDTIVGQQGDSFSDTGAAGSQNEFWVYGSSGAGSSLQGGAGDDVFHIQTDVGNDTITGGGGTDSIGFAGHASTDGTLSFDSATSTYTLAFTDGQTVEFSGISELYFTDTSIHLP